VFLISEGVRALSAPLHKYAPVYHNKLENHPHPLKMPRKIEVVINRLHIGHTKITHSYIINHEEPPLCNTCGVQVSIKHILTECLFYESYRKKANPPEYIHSSLSNCQESSKSLIEFITSAKLLTYI
jgi:hypothetical protein